MPEGSFSLVYAPADTSSSFYITFTEQIMVNHAIVGNNALVTGSVIYENDDLQYLMGVGKRYSFANTEYNRLFEGNLYYTLGTPEPTSGPSQRPSSSPSLRPSLQISDNPSEFPQQVISLSPSLMPSITLSANPTFETSILPSFSFPVHQPTSRPSSVPSKSISSKPSLQDTYDSHYPTGRVTSLPSIIPSNWDSFVLNFDSNMLPSLIPSHTSSYLYSGSESL